MENTLYFGRSTRRTPTACVTEPALCAPQHQRGDQIRIGAGPLAGMRGCLVKQAQDGRWVVQLTDLTQGVLLCIEASQFERLR
jgi:transcription antitermination factor NusG